MPLKISCDLGTQPVLHKYCHSGLPVLALLDISKLSTMSGFWCAFILKALPWLFFLHLVFFFFLSWMGGLMLIVVSAPMSQVSVLFWSQKNAF